MTDTVLEVSYYPGCSLATTARESNQSLVAACELMGLRLVEVEDWNCCGTSSAHSLDSELALSLGARNLVLAPAGRPLLVMCPSCFRNLLSTQLHLAQDPTARAAQERRWNGRIDPDLKIVSFLEILHFMDKLRGMGTVPGLKKPIDLSGLRVAPYYGCMAMFPPALRRTSVPFDLLERQLKALGAEVLTWRYSHRCCGTFLSVTRPDLTSALVNEIMDSAVEAEADCMVTACAMCQLNLEIRCSRKYCLPILHFSELIALSLGAKDHEAWFARHLMDPRPLLREKNLLA